ncbi:DUF4192 family protein [Nocardia sp. NPDC048505]|uniref:DUF4192 family protein n=1 Tax=Nocardia sp. NPDC048505 TaxID=3155756 RepID=UPI0033F7285D
MLGLTDLGEFCAAVPALLGYMPTERVVVLGYRQGQDRHHVTVALSHDPHVKTEKVAMDTAEILHRQGIAEVQMLVVAAERAPQLLALGERLESALFDLRIRTTIQLHAWNLETGAIWTDLETGHGGTVPDPLSSAAAARAVLQGRTIQASRDEIQSWFTHSTPAPDLATRRWDKPETDPQSPEFGARVLGELAGHVNANTLAPLELAGRTGALATASVAGREGLIGLAVINPAAAGRILTEIATHLFDWERAEVLTAAIVCWWAAGQGTVVNIAISAALAAFAERQYPPSAFLITLEAAYRHGMPPENIATSIIAAAETARRVYDVELTLA